NVSLENKKHLDEFQQSVKGAFPGLKDIWYRAGIYEESFSEYLGKMAGRGLFEYENQKYFNYALGKFVEVAPETQKRIVEARKVFIEKLQGISKETKELQEKGVEVSQEELLEAVRMSLSEWAPLARIS